MRLLVIVFIVLGITACSENDFPNHYPEKLKQLPVGLDVIHNPAEVYATENTKDPEKWGAYQMQFTTSVTALEEDLEIVEFGGYFWKNDQWEFSSMFDRPFNPAEFEKWYSCAGGELKKSISYSDPDNWLAKGDHLNGYEMKYLMYFIAINQAGNKFVGASEAIGYMRYQE
jgi:hypothetical protein